MLMRLFASSTQRASAADTSKRQSNNAFAAKQMLQSNGAHQLRTRIRWCCLDVFAAKQHRQLQSNTADLWLKLTAMPSTRKIIGIADEENENPRILRSAYTRPRFLNRRDLQDCLLGALVSVRMRSRQ